MGIIIIVLTALLIGTLLFLREIGKVITKLEENSIENDYYVENYDGINGFKGEEDV